jgi:hypothetical protein
MGIGLIRAEAFYRKHGIGGGATSINIPWHPNGSYRIGGQGTSNDVFEKRMDREEENLNANNLTLGTGDPNEYLKYFCKYPGLLLVEYNLMFKCNNLDKPTYIEHSICWGKEYGKEEKLHVRQAFSDGRNAVMTICRSQTIVVEEGDYASIEVNVSRDPSDPNFKVCLHPYHLGIWLDNYVSFTLTKF